MCLTWKAFVTRKRLLTLKFCVDVDVLSFMLKHPRAVYSLKEKEKKKRFFGQLIGPKFENPEDLGWPWVETLYFKIINFAIDIHLVTTQGNIVP